MPSASTPAMSDCAAITTLWPIAATGICPLWVRWMVNCVHDDGMVIESASYCMASVLSMVVAQSATTAGSLPWAAVSVPGAVVSVAGVSAGAAGAVTFAAATSAAGGAAAGSAGGAVSLPQ